MVNEFQIHIPPGHKDIILKVINEVRSSGNVLKTVFQLEENGLIEVVIVCTTQSFYAIAYKMGAIIEKPTNNLKVWLYE